VRARARAQHPPQNSQTHPYTQQQKQTCTAPASAITDQLPTKIGRLEAAELTVSPTLAP
jgi:hypothetical protein